MDFLSYIDDLEVPLSPSGSVPPPPPPSDPSGEHSYCDYFTMDDAAGIGFYDPIEVDPNHNRSKRKEEVVEEMETPLTVNKRLKLGAEKEVQATKPIRRLWVKDRSNAWWNTVNRPDFPDSEFLKAFRMSRATFDMICDELSPAIAKEDTMLRAAIPVRQRVAVCIWRLATGEPLRVVSSKFGLGISTCHKLILEVCSAIKSVLMPKFLQWPEGNRAQSVKLRFESATGIPNVIGSMYTTHIPIVAPNTNVSDYFNKRHTERHQKTSYSVTIQGVVDPDGVFTDVCIGYPGGMSDQQVLESSVLHLRMNPTSNPNNLLQQWIVGGSGYPLLDWVMVPYAHQNLTWTQHAFNEKASEVRRVATEAFGRLKGRWKCLQKRTEVKLQDLPMVLGACCVLHNVCEVMNEEMEPELAFDVADDDMVAENGVRSVAAVHVRDCIAHDLLHRDRVGPMLSNSSTHSFRTII